MDVGNEVAVYRKIGYGKSTYFNIVTFSARESKVMKLCVSYVIVSRTLGLNILYHMYVKKYFTLIDAVGWQSMTLRIILTRAK